MTRLRYWVRNHKFDTFYARRRSVTGYIYTYDLMEPNAPAERMQNEMIHDIEAAKPGILVIVVMPISWLAAKESEKTIFDWMEKYANEFYDTVGVVNFLPSGDSQSHWGADAPKYQAGETNFIYVLKRKSSN